MKIQLISSDINGHHSDVDCPFHKAIERTCPNIGPFLVWPTKILVYPAEIKTPTEMESWIIAYDKAVIGLGEDIAWGLNNLISVDLPLEDYCENPVTS